jgi:hypothetical protein
LFGLFGTQHAVVGPVAGHSGCESYQKQWFIPAESSHSLRSGRAAQGKGDASLAGSNGAQQVVGGSGMVQEEPAFH